MNSTCKNDSVDTAISDLHAWRRELSDQFGGDLRAIVEDAMRRQEQSGRRLIRRRERQFTPVNGASDSVVALLTVVEKSPKVPAEWVDELEQLIEQNRCPPPHLEGILEQLDRVEPE